MMPRSHLATLVADMQALGAQPAVVEHRGVRRFTATYAELAQGALRFAAELRERGIEEGERVVLWGANGAPWVACFFGCVLRGVLVVPLDAAGSEAFAHRIVDETSPRLLVGDSALLANLSASIARVELRSLALSDSAGPRQSYRDLVAATLSLDTPLQILFTSGTTGEPKGIVHTHRNLLASLAPIEREITKYRRYERLVHPLRILHNLPLSHIFGQFMGLWVAPVLGAVVHYESRLEAGRLLGMLRRERISVLAGVPRVLSILQAEVIAQSPPGLPARLSASRQLQIWKRWWVFRAIHGMFGYKFWAIVCGGATLPFAAEEFWTTLGIALIQGYGMTETSALVTLNHPFKPARGTLGAALPGRELRIAETGELEVRGEMVAAARWEGGALRRPDADDPAWLATGDLVRRDDKGRLQFLGRTGQRLVTASGLNVYLEDVEAAMMAQTAVRAAVAVAIETAMGPAAAVVLSADPAIAEAAVARANEALATHQRAVRWWLWPGLDLPRSSTGKVRRHLVEAWVQEWMEETSDREAGSPEIDPLLDLLAQATGELPRLPQDASADDIPLEALGLDSLGRVQLQAAMERARGRGVGDQAMAAARTLGDLRAIAVAADPSSAALDRSSAPAGVPLLEPAPVEAPLQISAYRYPRWPWAWPFTWLRSLFLEVCVRPLVWLLAGPRVVRAATQPPNGAPVLIVANHVSTFDVPLVLYALPGALRRSVAVAAAGEMLEDWRRGRTNQGVPSALGPMVYTLLTMLFNVFPLPRSHAFRESFAHAGSSLDHGYSVLIFPEGTRSHGAPMQPFRGGIGLLAAQAEVQVLPVALAHGRLVSGALRPFSATVSIGKPLAFDPAADPRSITARLEQAVRTLLDAQGSA